MPFRRLPLHHYTFRLALMYLALFSASFLLLFGFLVWNTDRDLRQQLRAELVNDALHFVERDQLSGEEGIIRLIGTRIDASDPTVPSLYVYRDPHQEILAGNFDTWVLPPRHHKKTAGIRTGLRTATIHHGKHHYLTLHQRLPSGGELLLGRSTAAIDAARRKLLQIFTFGSLLTLVLGIIGGLWLSRRAVVRIEAMNHLCHAIIEGDLSQRLNLRVPEPSDTDDDLDQLSHNINHMLDRIETLMHEVSTVSNHIAHDLRTPLSRLRNQLENLHTNSTAPEAEKRKIDQAIDEADQLLSTFNALLRIAKIESGQRQAAFELVDLNQIAADVVEMYAPIAEDAQLTLALIPASLSSFFGDRNLLFQAIANLVDNAIKHSRMAADGAVTVRIANTLHNQQSDHHLIQVCDRGSGIPEESLGQVTKRFYRLDTSRSTPGNGLGLSLVKAIASLHQGELHLSTNQPHGVCATLQLPQALVAKYHPARRPL